MLKLRDRIPISFLLWRYRQEASIWEVMETVKTLTNLPCIRSISPTLSRWDVLRLLMHNMSCFDLNIISYVAKITYQEMTMMQWLI